MRIVIDMQGAQSASRYRGIGRYSLSLAKAMIQCGSDRHEFFLALNGMFADSIEPLRAAFDGLLPQENIRVWEAVSPVHSVDIANNWRRLSAEYLREAFLSSLNPDIVHITSLVEGFGDDAVHTIGLLPATWVTAVTFYDAIPLIQREFYLTPNPDFEVSYREKIDYLRRAQIFLAISESSRQEAITYLGAEPRSVVNIAAAADDIFRTETVSAEADAQIRNKFGLSKQFIMYSGATDDRKNHLRLIEAFSKLPSEMRSRFQLAIVGGLPQDHKARFETHIAFCGLDRTKVVITGSVTDQELVRLYSLCHLFVFPSWHEGFGLPALEAMACGAPVIGSNTTSVPEVVGRDDALFDPFDVLSICEKIEYVLSNEEFRQSLRHHAVGQVSKFSWNKSAKLALAQFELILAERKSGVQENAPTILRDQNTDIPRTVLEKIFAIHAAPPTNAELLRLSVAVAKNHPRKRRPHLLVDVSELARRDARSGIQRVVRSILQELLSMQHLDFDVEPVWVANERQGYVYAKNFTRSFLGLPNINLAEFPIQAQLGDIFLGLDLQHHLLIPQGVFLHDLRRQGVCTYFVVYDLLPILVPAAFPAEWDQAHVHLQWLNVIADHDGVICISKAVADELLVWLEAFGPKRLRSLAVGFFHLGADFKKAAPTTGLHNDAPQVWVAFERRTNFLSVGTLEPRKGHGHILDAADALWSSGEDFNVVIVGKRGWKVDALVTRIQNHVELGTRLFWIEGASDEYLGEVYRRADCLIAASEAEGFGLPLIEAAHQGLPIIARDIPVFREVATDDAMFFGNGKEPSLASVMFQWLTRGRLGTKEIRASSPQKSWQESASDLLQVILQGNWYKRWDSPNEQRFWVGRSNFASVIGERKNLEIFIRPGHTGWALYGPYIPLQPGEYQVVLRGRVFGGTLEGSTVDVAIEGGDVLSETQLSIPSSPLDAVMAELRFRLTKKCEKFEVRVRVTESIDIALSHVSIRCLANLE